jgi:hypothetical protein
VQIFLQSGEACIRDVDAIEVTVPVQLAGQFTLLVILLHKKHESDTRHKPPVKSLDQLLIQLRHLVFTQISQRVEARLNLLWRHELGLEGHLFELCIDSLLVGCDGSHDGQWT